ncbi:MAG: hypothetical protein LBH05_07080 [Deferribacteraceae bacterium]|jgi:hypothetical protein|nr:hypothetical protein [Deferribacteraceae bacterium]
MENSTLLARRVLTEEMKEVNRIIAATAEARNNFEYLYKTTEDLKHFCTCFTAEEYANQTITQDMISELVEEVTYLFKKSIRPSTFLPRLHL